MSLTNLGGEYTFSGGYANNPMMEQIKDHRPIAIADHPQKLAPASDRPEWVSVAAKRWKVLSLGTIAMAVALSSVALVNGSAQKIEGNQAPVEPDKDALLALTESDFTALAEVVEMQLGESHSRLIDLEAVRFLQEAERQIADEGAPCYRLNPDCVLDQFEKDAVGLYQQGADTLDRSMQLQALQRIEIVDRASGWPTSPTTRSQSQALSSALNPGRWRVLRVLKVWPLTF